MTNSPIDLNSLSEFEKQFLIPGLTCVSEVKVSPAMPLDQIMRNIDANKGLHLPDISDSTWWRSNTPVAIVGGGPSLKETLEELRSFKYIMACGSVHDFLMDNGIVPTWCCICDPDGPIVNSYLSRPNRRTVYFVASQCDPLTFEHLRSSHVVKFNILTDLFDATEAYGEGVTVLGGGSTIATRAMVVVMGMGFYNFHLFGIDTCLRGDEHHAYEFQNEGEKVCIEQTYDIRFEADGPEFKVAGYHLGQLFDIKQILSMFANKIFVTVHGESLLSYFFQLAHKRYALKKEFDNGKSNRSNGVGDQPVPS